MIYSKNDIRISIAELERKGLTTIADIELHGYVLLDFKRPEYDPYTESITDSGTLDNKVVWDIKPLSDAAASKALDELRVIVIAGLKSDTSIKISQGFDSSALGVSHHYDSDKPTDQTNILAAVKGGSAREFTCTDPDGVKRPVLHSAAELEQVLADGEEWINSNVRDLWTLIDKANDPSLTPSELQQIRLV